MTTCLMPRDKSQRQTDRTRQEVPTYVNRFLLLQRLSKPPTVPSPSCFKRLCWGFAKETADVLTSFLPVSAQPVGTLCRNDSWDLTRNCSLHLCSEDKGKTARGVSSDNNKLVLHEHETEQGMFCSVVFVKGHLSLSQDVLFFFSLTEIEVIN